MANSLSPFVDTGNSQFSRQFDIETIGGDQRQRLAEMLRSNMLNQPQGQMVSGWYVAPNWTQYAANLANTAVGIIGGKMLDEERAKKTAEALKKFEGVEVNIPGVDSNANMAEGSTPISYGGEQTPLQKLVGGTNEAEGQTPMNQAMVPKQTRMRPLTQDEQDMAMLNLASVNPTMAGIYGNLQSARAKRAYDEEQRTLDRQARFDLARENMQGRMDLARMTAGLAAANRPEKMITAMDENGNPFTIPQSQFQAGMTIYNPTTAKAFKERQEKVKGLENLNDLTGSLRQAYGNLNQMNAIPSTQNRIGTNIGAKLASTGVGQWLGGAVGTNAQAERDKIAQTRPLLLNAIKNATGMSAKQMDSNAELNMYLRAATDPSLTYEANMEALNNLDRLYGLGLNVNNAPAIGAPPAGAVREKK